jgi:hypothetical protein
MKKIILFIVLFLFLGGCGPISPFFIVSPIIQGVITWQEGEARKYYGYNSTIISRAVKRAAESMDMEITQEDPPEEGNYYFVAGNNDRFKISVQKIEDNITLLSIRVNFMGDKPYAELFYKKVDEQLGIIEFDEDGQPKIDRIYK